MDQLLDTCLELRKKSEAFVTKALSMRPQERMAHEDMLYTKKQFSKIQKVCLCVEGANALRDGGQMTNYGRALLCCLRRPPAGTGKAPTQLLQCLQPQKSSRIRSLKDLCTTRSPQTGPDAKLHPMDVRRVAVLRTLDAVVPLSEL